MPGTEAVIDAAQRERGPLGSRNFLNPKLKLGSYTLF